MQYRKFGNTDLLVSEVGFGAWAIGGGATIGDTAIGWGDTDDYISQQAIGAALSSGINFFDTADIYGLGHSESILGAGIGNTNTIVIAADQTGSGGSSGHGKNIIMATKVGNVARNNQFTVDYTKQHIISACEASLKRLNRDVIDYYQLHSARLKDLNNGECLEAMLELQEQGKIRYWGLSLNTFDPAPEAEFLMDRNLGNGFQLVLNILNQRALPLLEKASAKGYGIIVRMPLQFGLLTGKFDKGASFATSDHRKNRLTPSVIQTAKKALQPVWELCSKYACTRTQLALSYILSHPEVSVVIPGIRTPVQVQENTNGLFHLNPEDLRWIEESCAAGLAEAMHFIQKQG